METTDIMEAMRSRNSVRRYTDRKIEGEVRRELQNFVDTCNAEGRLHFQLVTDQPGVFTGILARGFDNVSNYVALIRKEKDTDEKVGYYGEKVVLEAQRLGLNTCWVGLTYKKRKLDVNIKDDEKLVCVLALGYGADQGVPHKSKPADEIGKCQGEMPEWFRNGVEAAMLAPTAMNKQRFTFTLQDDGKVKAGTASGAYSEVDLGIGKLHFELGAGRENFEWA